ncbi:lysophospholipid acyltransferase family protein [Candidatus Mycoplasma mahonii]|uniref:lysophospholipid acyltransferase family protein n=1 Tax=Candidatus Mycoplasma mahonii TaxID=3004105 RepID=UPI0026ECE465|nr:lysophospholipid acyltransferase family protein [Candidatus Mycoplasma mahonii]WKX02226.1 lysophospholipid acyltransferase family protein [Candidatus Mycoplasma mahonii]
MNVKTKLILNYPIIAWKIFRSKVIARKIKKLADDDERYQDQWKNDYVLKSSNKLLKIFKVELIVKGFEHIAKAPAILAPNHSSYFDVALIMAALKNPQEGTDNHNYKPVFLAKESLRSNKRSKGFSDILNTFYINRKAPRSSLVEMDKFAEYAKEHKKYAVVFPEGTRTKNGEINDFKGGAFRIAKKTFISIIPVTINNSLSISDLSRKKTLKVEVIFGKALKPISFISLDNKSLAMRVKKEVQKEWKKPEGERSDNKSDFA